MLTLAHRTMPCIGESANGDAVVARHESNRALLAIVDGLGHGVDAAHAATEAARVLDSWPLADPLADLMQLLHERLRRTRGAAATVCLLHERALTGCTVGNVELQCSG